MKLNKSIFLILCLFATPLLLAAGGEMKVGAGYTFLDEMDNLSVYQGTSNLYEGFAFSVEDFKYGFDNGVNLNGNFVNTSLKNRNLAFSAYKSGLFTMSASHYRYRKIYSADGSLFTKRERTNFKASVQPSDKFKLFGGYNIIEKDGITDYSYSPLQFDFTDTIGYTQFTYNVGATGFCEYGSVTAEIRNTVYQDDQSEGFLNDRTSDQFKLHFYTKIPDYDEYQVFGGYMQREDKMDSTTVELKTTNFWGGLRAYFKDQYMFTYRMIAASTEDVDDNITTDNSYHTFAVQKSFARDGGIRVGYELKSTEDEFNKTSGNGFLINGWYQLDNSWFFKGKYSFASSEVDDGTILLSDVERSKHMISIQYVFPKYGNIVGKAEKKIKRYNDIANVGTSLASSEADYTKASLKLTLKEAKYGKLIFTNSYYLGKFENLSDETSYEFSDHVISTTVIPRSFGQFTVAVNGTYYRSRRDVDVEKFNFNSTVMWDMLNDLSFEAKYSAYTYDDLMAVIDTYTANIVEIKFIKNLSF
ncbi:MAG: hypothetical protein DWP97_02870 [Calditrichaeota bacterium]|nr:MAG: hypothetical protein DWP97_02870 [Calditrichota bacterium]